MIREQAARLGAAWEGAMLHGDFEQAWRASDAIHALVAEDAHRFWNGEPFAGRRIMLRCLHGFGDAVQFLRYVPRLRSVAASVSVEVPPRLVELARCFDGVEDVITWGEQAPAAPPPWDVQMEVMELPYIFRTQLADLPIAQHYLRLPVPAVQRAESTRLRVGLALTAGEWNASRSIAASLCAPLLASDACAFWNLAAHPADCSMLQEEERSQTSILGLAELISTLDLVITVDSLAAHLAGAMGIPAWVMLQQPADWRWMEQRDDSPWYPSLRLFRQQVPGDWQGVVRRIVPALQQLAQACGKCSA